MVAPYPLLILSLTTALGVLQLPVLPTFPQLLWGAAASVMAAALVSWLTLVRGSGPGKHSVCCGFMIAGAVLGTLISALGSALDWEQRQLPPVCHREPVIVDGAITGLVQRLPGPRRLYRFDLQVASIEPQRCAGPGLIRLYLDDDTPSTVTAATASHHDSARSRDVSDALQPGARITVEARLRRPWGMVNPAARHGEKTFFVAGLHAIGSVRALHRHNPASRGTLTIGAKIHKLRETVSTSVRRQVPGETGALLAALAVGDRRSMTPEMWSRLRLFGLTHLMVISGLHISMLAIPGWYFGVLLGLTRSVFPGRCASAELLAPLGAMIFASGYALLSGLALPAQRALLMLSLLMIPRLFGRRVNAVRMLPVAALILCILNPAKLLTASFWLTLGAVGLLLWFSAWRHRKGWLRDLWGTQGYMLIAMLPMGLFWFQEAGSVGAVVNLLAVPLITFFLVPLLLCAVVLEPLGASLAAMLLEGAAFVLSSFWSALAYWEPMLHRWSILRFSPDAIALVLALLGVVLVALPRFPGKVFIGALLLAPLTLPSSGSNDAVELTFFDVGQGTAVLLRHNDSALLYDTGGGPVAGPAVAARTIVPALQSMGIRALHTLIISHGDRDHDAGETVVSQRAPPRNVRRAVVPSGTGRACRLGEAQRFVPGVTIRYLSQHLSGDSDNNGSCVVLISVHGQNFLLAGDIDSDREREILRYWGRTLSADVLLAGHHGSASSNSRLWLRSLAPEMLVVTAGRGNRFGHPAQRVREVTAASGVLLLNTATRGAITFRVFPNGRRECHSARHRLSPFWRRGGDERDCPPP